ncbi:MAG: hypothetical protein JWN62_4356 [Acidimicrobiales bacterium]|nr:hypothetical protein [Acidimicrobiales bacterium]
MSEATPPGHTSRTDARAARVHEQRRVALHALEVLEYAVGAPAPRRHRTWLHRVCVAADALTVALRDHLPATDEMHLLDEIALTTPDHLGRIVQLRRAHLDLAIAVASLREQLEPEPTMDVDVASVQDKLANVARQFREHQAEEAAIVREATGIELDDIDHAESIHSGAARSAGIGGTPPPT